MKCENEFERLGIKLPVKTHLAKNGWCEIRGADGQLAFEPMIGSRRSNLIVLALNAYARKPKRRGPVERFLAVQYRKVLIQPLCCRQRWHAKFFPSNVDTIAGFGKTASAACAAALAKLDECKTASAACAAALAKLDEWKKENRNAK
jgi:hypothetical protein